MAIIKIILYICFLPFLLFWDLFRSNRSIPRKIGYFFLILLIFGTAWFSTAMATSSTLSFALFKTGIIDRLTKVKVIGTSMLPTIQDSSEAILNSPLKFGLERGDIISFKNQETGAMYYIKRIIGLPGEQVSLQNGFVLINGKILEENYIYNNFPTYGNTFLGDCDAIQIPPSHYLVLGDNRAVSSDSRVLGFIDKNDIDGVIKTHTQERFISESQQTQALKKQVDQTIFLEKLNDFRTKNQSSEIITYSELNNIAQKRADQIRDNLEDWKNQSIPAETSLQQMGYRYNLIHEYVTFGYLDEQTIIDQINESPAEKNQFLSQKFLEVGIGVSQKTKGACSFPIISVILSWPGVPTYDLKIINDWGREVTITTKLTNDLQLFVGNSKYDQTGLRSLITSIAEESEIATRIYNKMKSRQWLNEDDQRDINRYPDLVKTSEDMLKKYLGITIPVDSQNQSLELSQATPQPIVSIDPSNFQSAGQQIVEPGITANINSVTSDQKSVFVKITFGNNTSSTGNVTPTRLTMRSASLGTAPTPAIVSVSLDPGSIRSFDFVYKKLPDPPFDFYYLNSAGNSIKLGTYSPSS